jgi:hypothetical protein
MATTTVEPFAPWVWELDQVLQNRGTVGACIAPADRLIDDDDVTISADEESTHQKTPHEGKAAVRASR